MSNLEQAARQIIVDWDSGIHLYEAITALREALAHSGKANEFEPDWDGALGLVEEIKRLAIENERLRHGEIKYEDWEFNPMTGESLLVENHGQEPVAWAHPSGGHLSARYMKEFATGLEKETHTIPLYAAPVRTKDLTDDEIDDIILFNMPIESPRTFARAVIAKFKEKNQWNS